MSADAAVSLSVDPSRLREALATVVGAGGLLCDDEVTGRSAGIWRSDQIQARTLVRPTTTEQVAGVLRTCNDLGQSAVTHGGLTGLVEGALTSPGDVVLSLERMNAIESIDARDRTAIVQAGCVLQTVQEAAEAQNLLFPLDLGGRGSCTIGGNISTNAGGNRVIRYGMTRDLVLGVEAVLANGTVLTSMNRMIKNNAGYDLKQLFIGTEGTLGVVTRAVLRLHELPISRDTALVALRDFEAVTGFLKHMDRGLGGTLSAFEVLWSEYYEALTAPDGPHAPPVQRGYPFYVLVESMGGDAETDLTRFENTIGAAIEAEMVADAVVAQSGSQVASLWAIRDDVEQLFRFGPPQIFDVSLPVSRMEGYVAEMRERLDTEFDAHNTFVFGHLGDGNLHLVVSAGGESVRERVERAVYTPLAAVGGSVSAEHGVGLEKKPWLQLSRSEAEIEVMRTLKSALDPRGILNPGRIFASGGD